MDAIDPRQASRQELRRSLPHATREWILAALENPQLGVPEMVVLLRNRGLPSEVLDRVGTDRRWTANHGIRRAVALHPRTPLVVARNLLPHLFWRDWLDLSVDPAANPIIRRQAEKMLTGRLDELAVGERITLARRASRSLVEPLARSEEPRVVQALLGNPRLVESDVVRLCAAPKTAPEVLRRIAEHPAWRALRAVRLELLRRAELPVQILLGLARDVADRDLRGLLEDDRVPPIVRVSVERRVRRKSDDRS